MRDGSPGSKASLLLRGWRAADQTAVHCGAAGSFEGLRLKAIPRNDGSGEGEVVERERDEGEM